MKLVLQTNLLGRSSVWLVQDSRMVMARNEPVSKYGSDRTLELVDRVISDSKKKVADISGIVIVRGPGPFTAVRIGLSIANTLGLLTGNAVRGVITSHQLTQTEVLHLTATNYRRRGLVKPWYGKEPNISLAKPFQPQTVTNR